MIAKPEPHYDGNTLQELLDEQLSREQSEQVEAHLSQCSRCRKELEKIAGKPHWWEETIGVLSDSTTTPVSGAPRSSASAGLLDASLDWIRPLLEACPESPGSIGRLDQYLIQHVIGQGGMGVVLRGVDPELNRPVAIKVLSPHLAGVGAARARFMREAQAAAAIVHPSIVPIYSVVTSSRLPYIVMPCISGGNLQQRIDREGPLEISEVTRIGLQISEGLAAAHRQGVIHRDIKPANILVEEGNGRVLISDFGLARALDDATLTISGMIAGTPQFMSPEQARGEPIDARSDLFSLGSLLYALATGRPPFRAESPLAVLRKISDTRPRPVHQINEQIPPWFDAIITRLMQPKADDRISSADEVSQLLREAHAHVRNPSVHALPKSIARRQNRFAVPAMAVSMSFILLALFATTWSGSWFRETESNATASSTAGEATDNQMPSLQDAVSVDPSNVNPIDNQLRSHAWLDDELASELLSIQAELEMLAAGLEAATVVTSASEPDESSTPAP